MAEIGTGTSITFESGFFAEILDITGPSMERPAIDTTHMGTTNARTFVPGDLYDGGELQVELAFAPGTFPPIGQAASAFTITFPDSAASEWSGTGFLTSAENAIPLEERMTQSCTLKITGVISVS